MKIYVTHNVDLEMLVTNDLEEAKQFGSTQHVVYISEHLLDQLREAFTIPRSQRVIYDGLTNEHGGPEETRPRQTSFGEG